MKFAGVTRAHSDSLYLCWREPPPRANYFRSRAARVRFGLDLGAGALGGSSRSMRTRVLRIEAVT
jgi:hypothetical protein